MKDLQSRCPSDSGPKGSFLGDGAKVEESKRLSLGVFMISKPLSLDSLSVGI